MSIDGHGTRGGGRVSCCFFVLLLFVCFCFSFNFMFDDSSMWLAKITNTWDGASELKLDFVLLDQNLIII